MCFKEWNITSKLDVINTDSTENMLGMLYVSRFPSTYISVQCANHPIQNLIEAVRSVVKFANQLNIFCTNLENMQKEENPSPGSRRPDSMDLLYVVEVSLATRHPHPPDEKAGVELLKL